jgi:hypothetical protein
VLTISAAVLDGFALRKHLGRAHPCPVGAAIGQLDPAKLAMMERPEGQHGTRSRSRSSVASLMMM